MSTAPGEISPAHDRGGGRRPRWAGWPPLLRQTSIFREIFFVLANLVGFVAVNAFLYYLATGDWLDLTPASYRAALASPLSAMLLHPLNIFEQPWMMLVGALLVAAVVFVPIMVAVLYRLRVSALFVLAVAIVGHAPLLAAFLAVGCCLAGRTRLRSKMPLLAMLAGLCPVVVYLFFFSGVGEQVLLPLERVPVHLVFILSLVSAVLAGAVVLALARLTRFRPGIIWPVLLVLLAGPVWLFYEKIGPAELDYALIAARIGPGDAVLTPPGAAEVSGFRRAAASQPRSRPASRPSSRQVGWEILLAQARVDLEQRRAALLAECERFIQRYPRSARSAAVMWIAAAARDVRIDRQAIAAGSVKYICASPTAESKCMWGDLAERHPRSPQAFVAHQRLGIQAIREGRFRKAWEHLRTAQLLLMTYLGRRSAESAAAAGRIFGQPESLPSEQYYRMVLDETDTIIWLMETNKILDGGAKNAEAFREYMRLWPFADAAGEELRDLAEGYRDTELADNFRFRAAMAEEDLDRAGKLVQSAGEINDAAVAANYELGRLALRLGQSPAWSAMKLKSAEHYFKVVRSAQDNPYRAAAERHLAWLAGNKP